MYNPYENKGGIPQNQPNYGFNLGSDQQAPLTFPQQPYSFAAQFPNQAQAQPYTYSEPPPPYQAPGQQSQKQQSRENIFASVIQKYEISHDFANRLQFLSSFKIVFIFDDSSSMNSALSDSPLLKQNTRVTRWNELEYFASIALEIANLFDQSGSDVYFLNKQPPIKNIRNVGEFLAYFRQQKPNGYTPLARTLDQVLRDNLQLVNTEKKLLIIIVTDGEPTTEQGYGDIRGFKRMLESRTPADRIFTSIIACTDQNDSMNYLNHMDRSVRNLDVVDDFRNEKREVIRARGPNFPFTYGDYVVKSMIGSIDKSIDLFDEHGGHGGYGGQLASLGRKSKHRKDCIIS